MINFSPLPQRVRRIAKVYSYCIESVTPDSAGFVVRLKEGYQGKNGSNVYMATHASTEVIEFLKSVTKPASRKIVTALFGFKCPICNSIINKGSNYIDLGGLKICNYCGLTK